MLYIALRLTLLYTPVSFATESIRLQLAFESARMPEVEKALAELQTPCYTVREFSPEWSRVVNGVRLVPVPNIKVGLRGACSFLISKQFPESKKIYEALQIGLKDLRAKKQIKVRFVETGFYNPMAKDWHKLY